MILLAGGNTALLEGLAQAFANTGHRVVVAHSLDEARELQARNPPILMVAERGLLSEPESGKSFLHGTLAGGGALVTYREAGDTSRALPALLARHVLADLVLPLERNRLVALADHLATRAKAVGRQPDVTRPDSPAS
jgi:NAD(P)-dependent dehydrogenase (short-subunit alcohol dehydrogenase family)